MKISRVLSNRASHCGVLPSTPLADSPTRRRGKMSLLIRRDATFRISGALHLAIFEQPEKDDFSAFCYFRSFSFLSFLMIFGMKKEKTKRPTEKKTLRESN